MTDTSSRLSLFVLKIKAQKKVGFIGYFHQNPITDITSDLEELNNEIYFIMAGIGIQVDGFLVLEKTKVKQFVAKRKARPFVFFRNIEDHNMPQSVPDIGSLELHSAEVETNRPFPPLLRESQSSCSICILTLTNQPIYVKLTDDLP